MSKIKRSSAGFSLVELAVVILIAGFLLAGALVVGKAQLDATYAQITSNNIQVVQNALALYFSKNGYLPCPASFADVPGNATYGASRYSDVSGSPRSCSQIANGIFVKVDGSEETYMGAVPFKTLNIINDFMFDGWDNNLTYVVQRSFVNNEITNNVCIAASGAANVHTSSQYICWRGQATNTTNAGDIKISNYRGGQFITQEAVYVLISHGPNGLGAFKRIVPGASSGATKRVTLPSYQTAISERDNTNCDPVSQTCSTTLLNDTNFSMSGSTTEAGVFDDVVAFRTRNQMLYACNVDYDNKCLSMGSIK